MDSDELAREAVLMNRAIARCLHHLAELPPDKQGDFMLLLNDLQSKNMKLVDALQNTAADKSDSEDLEGNVA